MSKIFNLKIVTADRIGMALDILKVLYHLNVNLKALEVEPKVINAKIECTDDLCLEKIKELLQGVKDVYQVEEVTLLPQEIREKYLKAVLEATSEGILAVDSNGIITTMNHSAEEIFGFVKENAINRSIAEVLSPDLPILKTIKDGQSYDNLEVKLDLENKTTHYVTSGRPILNFDGKPIGAVATIKDIESAMDLVYNLTKPVMISFDEIIGQSEIIQRVKNIAKTVAQSNSTVLIRGESGTGKELFARAIHMASSRKNMHFVPVNCAALPDTLLESELFGYEEGSFTGAKKGGKQGLFKYADKGTIFLDEIGELPPHMQVKLLRVLQEFKIRRVGSDAEIPVDVRVIAATNKNLEEMLKREEFREDLYYRLNVIPLTLPPLRERKGDIPILINHVIQRISSKINKKVSGITSEAMDKLSKHSWPGNIRELSNVIERALNLCSNTIELDHIILKGEEMDNGQFVLEMDETHVGKTLEDWVAKTEREIIKDALEKYQSIRKAAKVLGVTHGTIINKMKKYNLSN